MKRSNAEWKERMIPDYNHYDRDVFDMYREKYSRLMKKPLFDKLMAELFAEQKIKPAKQHPWDKDD